MLGSKISNYYFRLYLKSPIFKGFLGPDLTYPSDLTMFRPLRAEKPRVFRDSETSISA